MNHKEWRQTGRLKHGHVLSPKDRVSGSMPAVTISLYVTISLFFSLDIAHLLTRSCSLLIRTVPTERLIPKHSFPFLQYMLCMVLLSRFLLSLLGRLIPFMHSLLHGLISSITQASFLLYLS